MNNLTQSIFSQLKSHPATVGFFSFCTSVLGIWLAENAQVIAGWSATLASLGSFIIIVPKIIETLRSWVVPLRRWACRKLIWAIRKLRS